MLTLGTYLNLIEAGLAKSFLDDHDVFCSLFDENAHLYGGAPFAMPIRLVVVDAQFQKAARVLADARRSIAENGDETAAPFDQETVSEEVDQEMLAEDQQESVQEGVGNNYPWEILAIAYLFLVPGLGFLLEKRPLILVARRSRWRPIMSIVLSPVEVHFVGALLITAALLLTLFYFHMRRLIARGEQAALIAGRSAS